jgi:hypothetical protein
MLQWLEDTESASERSWKNQKMILTRDVAFLPKVINHLAVVRASFKPCRLPIRLDIDALQGRHVDLDTIEATRRASQRMPAVLDNEGQAVLVRPCNLGFAIGVSTTVIVYFPEGNSQWLRYQILHLE